MKNKMIFIVAVGFAIFSCSKRTDSSSSDEISGAYTRAYSYRVINPENGKEIGMRSVRDTIFIEKMNDGYEISNNKWQLNDYDREGWKNMKHEDDRSIPTFHAKFDHSNGTLVSEINSPLYLNIEKTKLSKKQNAATFYQRVK